VREHAEARRKRMERWYDLIVGAAILGALLAFLYFFASAALAASTVIVNPGTLTQANLDAAGVNGTLRLITGQYQCATQLKPLAGQSFIGSGKISAVPYLDTATVPGFSIPSFKLTYGTGDRRAGRLLRFQDQRCRRHVPERRLQRQRDLAGRNGAADEGPEDRSMLVFGVRANGRRLQQRDLFESLAGRADHRQRFQ
jgi:hypothetical protein